jgi:hypothetical protein
MSQIRSSLLKELRKFLSKRNKPEVLDNSKSIQQTFLSRHYQNHNVKRLTWDLIGRIKRLLNLKGYLKLLIFCYSKQQFYQRVVITA